MGSSPAISHATVGMVRDEDSSMPLSLDGDELSGMTAAAKRWRRRRQQDGGSGRSILHAGRRSRKIFAGFWRAQPDDAFQMTVLFPDDAFEHRMTPMFK